MKKLYSFVAVLATITLLSGLLAGCGAKTAEKKLQIAVLYDAAINRQQEQYFDAIANAVIISQKMHPDKIEVDHIRIPINDDSRLNFIETQLSQFHYDLVIDTDVNYTNSIEHVAEKHPQTSFVVVDPGNVKRSAKANVTWIVFNEKQQGFVAGVIAALKKPSKIVHLDLSADDVNPDFDTGINAGLRTVNNGSSLVRELVVPEMKQRADLPGSDLYERTRAKASELYRNGADIIISDWEVDQLAVLNAARENKKFLIASDVSIRHLVNAATSDNLLDSVVKNYKLAITDTITAAVEKTLKAGDKVYDLSNEGIIYRDATNKSANYQSLIDDADKYIQKLKQGELKID